MSLHPKFSWESFQELELPELAMSYRPSEKKTLLGLMLGEPVCARSVGAGDGSMMMERIPQWWRQHLSSTCFVSGTALGPDMPCLFAPRNG